jgi:hypothetical protein
LTYDRTFHSFNTRLEFLQHCRTLLSPSGIIAFADLIPLSSTSPSILLRIVYLLAGVPRSNMIPLSERREQLESLGFVDIHTVPITADVLPHLSDFLHRRMGKGKDKGDNDGGSLLRGVIRPGIMTSYTMFAKALRLLAGELGFALIVARKPNTSRDINDE